MVFMGIKDIAIKSLSQDFPKMYIKLKIKDKDIANQTIKGYELILKNNLFDEDFYLNKYPKLVDSDLDLLLHYIFFGFDEGKDPSAEFDSVFYKNHYEDVTNSKLNPLIHYALYGLNENRLTKPENKPLTEFIDDNKKRILYISHEKVGTVGGTGFTNLDIISEVIDDYQTFILTSTGYEIELWQITDQKEKIANFNIAFDTDFTVGLDNTNEIKSANFTLFNEKIKNIYVDVIKSLKIDLIHINHLINHSFDLTEVANSLNIPYILSIHDFYYLCPSIHLINNKSSFCNMACLDNHFNCKCVNIDDESNFSNLLQYWRENTLNLLNNAYKIIFPSQSSIDLYKQVFPDLNNVKLIEHGRDFEDEKIKATYSDSKPIKIAIPGHISPHKGSFLIKDIKNQDKDNKLEFHFVGTTRPLLKDVGKTYGRYDRNELGKILKEINPSFVGIFSTCPETFSHTLSESWNLGLPVIATDLGALSERISKSDAGWLVDYEDPKEIYNQIVTISQNKEDYENKVKNINNIVLKSKQEMAKEYLAIYNEMELIK